MGEPVQTTQKTGKFWKLLQMVGVLGILGCATWGMIARDSETSVNCIVIGLPAAAVWAFGRVGAWWFHE